MFFHVNFVKFLRTPFLQNNSGRLLPKERQNTYFFIGIKMGMIYLWNSNVNKNEKIESAHMYKYVYIIYMYIYHILTCTDLKINITMYILMLYMGIYIYICETFPHKWKNLCFDELPIPIAFFMSFICTLLLLNLLLENFNIRSFYHIWRHVKFKARWHVRRERT